MKQSYFPKRDKIRIGIFSKKEEKVHFHRDVELLFILKGFLNLNSNNENFKLDKGEFFIVNSNSPHSFKSHDDATFMQVLIDYNLIRDVVGNDYFYFRNDLNSEVNKAKRELKIVINQLLHYYMDRKSEKVADFAYLSTCYKILDILSTFYLEIDKEKKKLSLGNTNNPKQLRVTEIDEYLHLKYSQNITLQSLAEHLYLTPSYLSKYFKRTFGMNFKKYLTLLRLEHALDDVLYTGRPLTSIAYENGFPSVTAFGKSFYEQYGDTPQELRKRTQVRFAPTHVSKEGKQAIKDYLLDDTILCDNEFNVETSVLTIKTLSKKYQDMINIGPAEEFLNSETQKHVLLMKERLGIKHLRFWNIFAEELLVSTDGSKQRYNFTKLNHIFDFLVKNDIYPHIELSIKDKIISRTAEQSIKLKNKNNDFSTKQLQKVLEPFLKHVINRYGNNIVEQWRFELGLNEWELGKAFTINDYFEKFTMVYNLCKKYSPKIQVGGCGYNAQYSSHLDGDFWREWAKESKRPDFISLTSYAYNRLNGDDEYDSVRSRDKAILKKSIGELRRILIELKWNEMPIYVSEWNLSFSDRNYINDTCFKGCYILENVFTNFDTIISYYCLSDQLSEYYDSSDFLYGGLGLIAKESIFKPAAHAYEFLNNLDNHYFAKSPNYIMTTDENDSYTILCHNKQELTNFYYATEEDKIDTINIDQYFNCQTAKYHFVLKDVRSGHYRIKTKSISQDKGSILAEWRKLGYYNNLSLSDIEYLKGSSIPKLEIKEIKTKNNKLDIELELSVNEFTLVKIKRI